MVFVGEGAYDGVDDEGVVEEGGGDDGGGCVKNIFALVDKDTRRNGGEEGRDRKSVV